MMDSKAIEILKILARREEVGIENASSGGNYDDAYYGGWEDGESLLARQILTIIGEDW